MEKRKYTHVQKLLPEIEGMIAEGKTQREVADHFGFKDKNVKTASSAAGKAAKVGGRNRTAAQGKAEKRHRTRRRGH